MDKLLNYLMLLLISTFSLTVTSCGDDNDEHNFGSASIVGQWVDGDETLTFGKDGSYREDYSMGQYRIGTYSYSASTSLLVVNIKAVAGMNSAYQRTYIVQTLTSTTLVLMETDGDVKGFFTRK